MRHWSVDDGGAHGAGTGMPPTAEAETLAMPWAISSWFGSWRVRVNWSRMTQVFSVSMESSSGSGHCRRARRSADLQFADFPPACQGPRRNRPARDVDQADDERVVAKRAQVDIVDGEHEIGQQPGRTPRIVLGTFCVMRGASSRDADGGTAYRDGAPVPCLWRNDDVPPLSVRAAPTKRESGCR